MEPEKAPDDTEIILTREKALQLLFELASALGYEVTLVEKPLAATEH